MTTPAHKPEPAPQDTPPLPPPTPGCSAAGCANPPLVQWQRRPTGAELAAIVAVEQARRDEALINANPKLPRPVFRPLPAAKDITIAVFGCNTHAISQDLAALVHAANCTAPNPSNLPGCDCTPEPAPRPEPMHAAALPLPDHWQNP